LRTLQGVAGVQGRVLLCALFLAAAVGYSNPSISEVAELLASKGIPAAKWILATILVIGSLSVVVGYRARLGASLLLVMLGLATYYFGSFNFWTLVNAEARQEQIIRLVTSLSLMGAMLFIIANGPGRMSLDSKRR